MVECTIEKISDFGMPTMTIITNAITLILVLDITVLDDFVLVTATELTMNGSRNEYILIFHLAFEPLHSSPFEM